MATLECFRDIGVEEEAMRIGHPETDIGPWYRFSNTVTSGELFKRFAFGTSPLKQVFTPIKIEYLSDRGLTRCSTGRVLRGKPLRKTRLR